MKMSRNSIRRIVLKEILKEQSSFLPEDILGSNEKVMSGNDLIFILSLFNYSDADLSSLFNRGESYLMVKLDNGNMSIYKHNPGRIRKYSRKVLEVSRCPV